MPVSTQRIIPGSANERSRRISLVDNHQSKSHDGENCEKDGPPKLFFDKLGAAARMTEKERERHILDHANLPKTMH